MVLWEGLPPVLPTPEGDTVTSRYRPVTLEVLAYMPADLMHCAHCERLFDAADIAQQVHGEIQSSYPTRLRDEAARLAAWLQELSARYRDRLRIRVVDPQSPLGLIRALRYGIRRYPAFVIDGQKHYGWDLPALEQVIAEQVKRQVCDTQVR
jgi:hypothetical protein